MGYALLWIENLAVSLLLMALIFAVVGRLRWRWLRWALWLPVWIVLLLAYAFVAFVFFTGSREGVTGSSLFWAMSALAVCFFVGTAWLIVRGSRRDSEGLAPTAAGGWPRGKLAIGLGVAVALHLMTFWNLDLSARQQVESLRAEAGALALSVAPPRVSDRDNAAILYDEAFKAMGPKARWPTAFCGWFENKKDAEGPFGSDEPLSSDLRDVVRNWSPVISLLHQAAAKPDCYFQHDYGRPSFAMRFPELNGMMAAAALLALNAQVKANDGDLATAVRDVRCDIRFGPARRRRTDHRCVGRFNVN